jgi:hypothetical protein
MITRAKIKLGEELGAVELVQQLVDDRNWKGVLDGDGVEGAIVDAEPSRSIMLPDEEDWRGERRKTRPNEPLYQHRRALAFQLILVSYRVAVGTYRDQLRARNQRDAMVPRAVRRQAVRFREGVGERSEQLVQ